MVFHDGFTQVNNLAASGSYVTATSACQTNPSLVKLPNGTTIATDNARFKASLRKQIAYKIEVLAQGYRPHHEDITLSEDLTDANKIIQLRKEVYTFRYKAVDAQSKQVVPSARLQFYNLTGKRPVPAKNLNNGEYEVEFNPDSDYFVDIEATGYEKVFAKVDVDQLAGRQDFNQSIVLNALKKEETKTVTKEEPKRNEEFDNLKVGKVVRLDNVSVEQSSYILRPESYEQLDRLSQSLKNAPALKIEIAGHTDNVGDPRLNLILSENRAKVIASYLYNKGIKDNRIIEIGPKGMIDKQIEYDEYISDEKLMERRNSIY